LSFRAPSALRRSIKKLVSADAAVQACLNVSGPLPPDTLTRQRGFDIFYALYHDQGLIAAKALPEEAAHVTLGLPFIRTSPDHGVAYDLRRDTGKSQPRGHARGAALGIEIISRSMMKRRRLSRNSGDSSENLWGLHFFP
jgi:4-hydroxy-L-threonine phosphate dehydrogenase PdxA